MISFISQKFDPFKKNSLDKKRKQSREKQSKPSHPCVSPIFSLLMTNSSTNFESLRPLLNADAIKL